MHCACTRDTWYTHGRRSAISQIRKNRRVKVKEHVWLTVLISVVESDASQRFEHNTLKSYRSLPSQTLGGGEALIAILAAGLACASNIPESFLEEAIRTLTSNKVDPWNAACLGWQGWNENLWDSDVKVILVMSNAWRKYQLASACHFPDSCWWHGVGYADMPSPATVAKLPDCRIALLVSSM